MLDRNPIGLIGSRGFIGSNLSEFLVSQGEQVIHLDISKESLGVGYRQFVLSSTGLEALASLDRENTIIFVLILAGCGDESISQLIKFLKEMGFKRVIYTSSLSADMPPTLLEKSRYARDKAISETACINAGFVSIRLGLVFSGEGFGLRAGSPPLIKVGRWLFTLGGNLVVYPISIELVVNRLFGLCDDSFWKYLEPNWRGKKKIFNLVGEPWILTDWVKAFYQSKGYVPYCFALQSWMLAALYRISFGALRDRIVGMYWSSIKKQIPATPANANQNLIELQFGISEIN